MEVNVQRDYQPLFTLVQPLHTEMADKVALTVYALYLSNGVITIDISLT